MKKLLIALALVFALTLPAQAEEIQWLNFNTTAEVDAHYFLNKSLKGSYGGGVAVEFAQIADNLIGLRGELVLPVSEDETAPDKLGGIGATLKIQNVINKIGGKTIVPSNVQIGVSALFDLTHGIDVESIKSPFFSLLLVGIQF